MSVINSESLELLEFHKIKKQVYDWCYSNAAKQKANSISVITSEVNLKIELHKVAELVSLLTADTFFPNVEFEEFFREASLLSLNGSMLTEEQFLLVKTSTEISNTAIRYLKNKKTLLPNLSLLVNEVDDNKLIIEEIDKIIDFDATVKNSASRELQKIRKDLSDKKRESNAKFDRHVNELRKQGYLRDNEESFFNGRRTLAVLVEYKSEVTGFVHSKSETGKTIFVEPGATIAINNDIAELEVDERREINRILRELSDNLRPFATQLKHYYYLLVELDFLKAKAKFAQQINACLPTITTNKGVKLIKAYHPLLYLQNKLQNKLTVPLTINLNEQHHLVIISGPNAGGKSITLKTIGLLQVMLQSGLLVSVADNSEMSFFEYILIDIGDTQSIEHELSTYSARLKNMIDILKTVSNKTFFVIT